MSDPAPKLDVSKHRQRRRLLLGFVGVMLVVIVLFGSRDSDGILEGGVEAATSWVIAFAVVIAIVALIVPMLNSERRRLAARVGQARPGSTVIPGNASADTKIDAPEGVSRRGLRMGGGPLAVALLPQTIEVCSRGDTAPRWTIDRTKAEVAVAISATATPPRSASSSATAPIPSASCPRTTRWACSTRSAGSDRLSVRWARIPSDT
jgi:hypothetical protein